MVNLLCCGGSEKSRALKRKKGQQERRGDLDPVTSWSGVGEVLAGTARCWLELRGAGWSGEVLAGAATCWLERFGGASWSCIMTEAT